MAQYPKKVGVQCLPTQKWLLSQQPESQPDVFAANFVDWDSEYRALEATVGEGDKAGLAAIKALHHQLDDDHDGTIEPQETGDFIKADLKVIACQGSMRSCRYI